MFISLFIGLFIHVTGCTILFIFAIAQLQFTLFMQQFLMGVYHGRHFSAEPPPSIATPNLAYLPLGMLELVVSLFAGAEAWLSLSGN